MSIFIVGKDLEIVKQFSGLFCILGLWQRIVDFMYLRISVNIEIAPNLRTQSFWSGIVIQNGFFINLSEIERIGEGLNKFRFKV